MRLSRVSFIGCPKTFRRGLYRSNGGTSQLGDVRLGFPSRWWILAGRASEETPSGTKGKLLQTHSSQIGRSQKVYGHVLDVWVTLFGASVFAFDFVLFIHRLGRLSRSQCPRTARGRFSWCKMSVAASAIYFLNLRGDVVNNRLYPDDVGLNFGVR